MFILNFIFSFNLRTVKVNLLFLILFACSGMCPLSIGSSKDPTS